MLTYEFQVSLPVLARTLHGGSGTYGVMMGVMGLGAIAGGLVTAARGRIGLRPLSLAAAAFGILILLAAAAPSRPLELLALLFAGAASVSFIAIGNTTLQLNAAPAMRGRVMSLWFVGFQGSTPIGGPIVGARDRRRRSACRARARGTRLHRRRADRRPCPSEGGAQEDAECHEAARAGAHRSALRRRVAACARTRAWPTPKPPRDPRRRTRAIHPRGRP